MPQSKKRKPVASKTTTTTEKVGDKLITVETTLRVDDVTIDYADIVEACTVKQDKMYEAPWENCDGFDHDTTHIDTYDYPDRKDSERYFNSYDHHDRDNWIDTTAERMSVGDRKYFHAAGASKQVAFELEAQQFRAAIRQLNKWHSNGWEWYVTSCEFKGHHASCGGIDTFDYADGEMRQEIAAEIVGYLEEEGYTVVNQPTPVNHNREHAIDRYRRNVNLFNVEPRSQRFNRRK